MPASQLVALERQIDAFVTGASHEGEKERRPSYLAELMLQKDASEKEMLSQGDFHQLFLCIFYGIDLLYAL